MFHCIISFTIILTLFLAYSSSTKGLVAPLIPPMSPQSPFYAQVLEFNNISTTKPTNISLNQDHYIKWLLSKTLVSPNGENEVYFEKNSGSHVLNMYMGVPIQIVYGVFDTASSIIWFECKEQAARTKFPFFNQTRSLTYTTVNCTDEHRCNTHERSIKGCNDIIEGYCEFKVSYADLSKAFGVMGMDRITFERPRWEVLLQLVFGCSWDNNINSMGIIGASNSEYSLPKQLNADDPKFSYCISDDFSKTNLVSFGADAKLKAQKLNMISNPNTNFYYIDVVSIQVNGETIDVPPSVFKMSSSGKKGFIIDSGTSLTRLTLTAFNALKAKVEHFLGPPTKYSIFEICYDHGSFGKLWPRKKRPTIGLELRQSQNFVFVFEEKLVWQKIPDSNNLECLVVLRTSSKMSVLGYFQLLNVNVGYDPKNSLLYLQKTTCPSIDNN